MGMTEKLLQYIWQFQYFNRKELTTTDGEELDIVCQGQYNRNQGPDFLEGKIKIGKQVWIGNIELHVNASDWDKHLHSFDANYENVILHVVWNKDAEHLDMRMPTLELADRISKMLLHQYESWLNSDYFIPCAAHLSSACDIVWTSWKERLMVERLGRKSESIIQLLQKNKFHWEETLWWMLARTFGLVINAEAFAAMASSIPYNLILKHSNQIHQLEALMFGQAGMLEGRFKDKYVVMMQKEYGFLKNKYELTAIRMPVHYLRMRPACFPTVRLAQLAMLMQKSPDLFSCIVQTQDTGTIKTILNVPANDYWHYHFVFDEETGFQPKNVGAQLINSLMINAIVPLLFTYGMYKNEESFKEKALDWISQLAGEKNSVTQKFKKVGVYAMNAAESQALTELKTQYCDQRRCLDCAIGNLILKGITQ
jgi:hypothetical protein